jgi:HK97 family phage portal protein
VAKSKTRKRERAVQTREAVTRVGTIAIPARDARGMGADRAMRVPAFRRGSTLITGTVAQLPLSLWKGQVPTVPSDLCIQPEVDCAYYVTMQRLAEDLLHYARAYWKVILTDSDGYPVKVQSLPAADVTENDATPGWVIYKGDTLRLSDPVGPGTTVGHVIKFTGFRKGVLADGIDTIELAIALEDAALNYAKSPLPQLALKNDGADLTSAEVKALLTEWETARTERSTAYLNSVMSTEQFGWSSSEMQLVDARNQAAIEIARLMNLDPSWIGAGVQGSSLTYTNREDLRRDLIDLTLSDYIAPIEQRLSMRDVTPTKFNNVVRFATNQFLRANLEARASIVATLLPLGAITLEDAQSFLSDSPNTNTYPS